MKVLFVSLLSLSAVFAADLSWKCEATCFKKKGIDYSRTIVSSYSSDKMSAFKEIVSQCQDGTGKETFLRDYIYRGGIPVVNDPRHDFNTKTEISEEMELSYYCKDISKKVAKL